jgi:hypothetical protein
MSDFYQFLADHNIEYERHDHPAVYTVEESDRLVPPLPGAKTKNLERFIEATGHEIQISDVPGQD